MARARIYSLLSNAFSYPEGDWRQGLLGQAKDTAWALRDPALHAFPSEIVRLVDGCLESLRATRQEEALRAHLILFGHSSGGQFPPYEIEYGPKSDVIGPNRLADVASFYKAFGLGVAPGAGERLDHLSVEFEFLHYLCMREAHALAQDHPADRLELLRDAQRKFLQEHLGRFAPVFAKKVMRSAENTLYGQFAALADRFILSDCNTLGADPRVGVLPLEPRRPPTDEDLCVSCEQASSCGGSRPAAPTPGPERGIADGRLSI